MTKSVTNKVESRITSLCQELMHAFRIRLFYFLFFGRNHFNSYETRSACAIVKSSLRITFPSHNTTTNLHKGRAGTNY